MPHALSWVSFVLSVVSFTSLKEWIGYLLPFLYPPNRGLFGIRKEMEKLQQGVVNQLDMASKQQASQQVSRQVSHLEEAGIMESRGMNIGALQECVYGMQDIVNKTLRK